MVKFSLEKFGLKCLKQLLPYFTSKTFNMATELMLGNFMFYRKLESQY